MKVKKVYLMYRKALVEATILLDSAEYRNDKWEIKIIRKIDNLIKYHSEDWDNLSRIFSYYQELITNKLLDTNDGEVIDLEEFEKETIKEK